MNYLATGGLALESPPQPEACPSEALVSVSPG
jgi:hypothetical protein